MFQEHYCYCFINISIFETLLIFYITVATSLLTYMCILGMWKSMS